VSDGALPQQSACGVHTVAMHRGKISLKIHLITNINFEIYAITINLLGKRTQFMAALEAALEAKKTVYSSVDGCCASSLHHNHFIKIKEWEKRAKYNKNNKTEKSLLFISKCSVIIQLAQSDISEFEIGFAR
jgi:hypothetical protein